MLISCVKQVQKTVKKSEQKSFNLFVQKLQKVEKIFILNSFTQLINKLKWVLHILINWFYTLFLFNSSLLNRSFALFPHRSTITTTLLNIKKENF